MAEDIDYFGFGYFGESGEPLRLLDGRERAPRLGAVERLFLMLQT
jgi:hypothetical protein